MPCATSLNTLETRWMALFVGPKHCGKTVAACSVMTKDSQKRVKVLDCDGRIRGINGAPWIDKSRIDYDYFPPRVAGQSKPFFQRVNEDLDALLINIQQGRNQYETYVGDSATAFTKNLILDAIPLTHKNDKGQAKGRRLGAMELCGVEEYKFESTGMDGYLSYLRSLPMNVIVTAHVIPKWGVPEGQTDNPDQGMAIERTIIGEELSLRAKIAANTSIYFDHIFRFDRRMSQGEERFFVRYISDIACTSFPNMPTEEVDITGENFYEFTMDLVRKRNPDLAVIA